MKPFLGLIKQSLLTPEQGAAPVLRLAAAQSAQWFEYGGVARKAR